MADYAIGDLQGCYDEFQALLTLVNFNPAKDHLYLVGDIVARGPKSLACLEYLYKNQDSVTITLGNHDLHMIACYLLGKPINPKDNLDTVFSSPKLSHYIHFLRQQPLALWLKKYKTFISHAGLNPDWSISKALKHAQFATQCYQSDEVNSFLMGMYAQHPPHMSKQLTDIERFRFIVNYFTRMRFLTLDGKLELKSKGAIDDKNTIVPWFSHPRFQSLNCDIIFGHWAALEGKTPLPNLHALDTGCVWGGEMTLMELKNKQSFSVNSNQFI